MHEHNLLVSFSGLCIAFSQVEDPNAVFLVKAVVLIWALFASATVLVVPR